MTCVTESATGWDRILKFYDRNEPCLEREIVLKTTRITFMTTFVLGGLAKRLEANRRVQVYTTGVTFASPSLRVVSSKFSNNFNLFSNFSQEFWITRFWRLCEVASDGDFEQQHSLEQSRKLFPPVSFHFSIV
jgi:hypothetical protein